MPQQSSSQQPKGGQGGESVVKRDQREGQVGHRRVCMFGMQLRDSDPIRGIPPWARCRSGEEDEQQRGREHGQQRASSSSTWGMGSGWPAPLAQVHQQPPPYSVEMRRAHPRVPSQPASTAAGRGNAHDNLCLHSAHQQPTREKPIPLSFVLLLPSTLTGDPYLFVRRSRDPPESTLRESLDGREPPIHIHLWVTAETKTDSLSHISAHPPREAPIGLPWTAPLLPVSPVALSGCELANISLTAADRPFRLPGTSAGRAPAWPQPYSHRSVLDAQWPAQSGIELAHRRQVRARIPAQVVLAHQRNRQGKRRHGLFSPVGSQ